MRPAAAVSHQSTLSIHLCRARELHGLTVHTTVPLCCLRYLRGWIWIDAPSSIPVEILTAAGGNSSGQNKLLGSLRVLRMFRLVRLLRLIKIEAYVARLEEILDINLRAIRLVLLTCANSHRTLTLSTALLLQGTARAHILPYL
jgi:hypothetical protein